MKRFLTLLIAVAMLGQAYAQIEKPKSMTLGASTYTAKKGEVIELILSIVPMDHFHVYSEKWTCPPEATDRTAQISFSGSGIELVGKPFGVGYKMEKDDLAAFDKIDCEIGIFPGTAIFKQRVRITGLVSNVKCDFNGQMCSDSRCIPIRQAAALSKTIQVADLATTSLPTNDVVETVDTPKTENNLPRSTVPNSNTAHSYKAKFENEVGKCEPLKYSGNLGQKNQNSDNKDLWLVFWLALSSGFLALLTPCVFPMIPMTVSFFIKNKDRKKGLRDGLIFAFSIILIYVVIGTIVAATFGASAANWVSTHWAPNVFFFAIFMVFAASFFGAFEIVLPSSWVNAMDKRADKGGFAGPVFMALTIALVSFSCTGPIVGTVLVEATKGGIVTPIIAMFGFSLAFALPFGLLVVFPSYLQNLPKSGGWLNSVKVLLGFVEVAFALKFLSTADQTYHWHILDREVYLALWIVIFTLMGVYLLGKLKFSHDSDMPHLSVPRLMLSIVTFSFVVYLIPGMWGAPLKALAGYLPPMSTQDFDIRRIAFEANGKAGETCSEPMYSEEFHFPHGITGYFDYEQALACAKEQKKPVFIDFTGHGCVNCRRMEEKVWSDPAVLKLLKTDYVVVSLYVDDKKVALPESEHFVGRSSGKKITLLSEKNAEIQACYFNSNSQPQYILMSADETMLQHPGSAETFEYDPKKFAAFLKFGLAEFRAMKPKN
jgi:thiol:disulfide interchange protein